MLFSAKPIGHLLAIFTIFVWSITYISTKILVADFHPVEILIIRFIIGMLVLSLLYPHLPKFQKSEEPFYVLAGLTGGCLYFLIENYAVTMTTATNVGIILVITPMLTAIANKICYPKSEPITLKFVIGFLLAFIGIIILSLKGTGAAQNNGFQFNPMGDSLAVLAGAVFAVYSVVCRKIGYFAHNTLDDTRKTFFYGVLFIIPTLFFVEIEPYTVEHLAKFLKPANAFNILFLGIIASALCFGSWNQAVKVIGPVTTIVYLYATPIITLTFAYLILGEQLTILGYLGCVLIMLGLVLSQNFSIKDIKQKLFKK